MVLVVSGRLVWGMFVCGVGRDRRWGWEDKERLIHTVKSSTSKRFQLSPRVSCWQLQVLHTFVKGEENKQMKPVLCCFPMRTMGEVGEVFLVPDMVQSPEGYKGPYFERLHERLGTGKV